LTYDGDLLIIEPKKRKKREPIGEQSIQ